MTYRHDPYKPCVITPCAAPFVILHRRSFAFSAFSVSFSSDEGSIGSCDGNRRDLSICGVSVLCDSLAVSTASKAAHSDKVANHYKTRMCESFTANGYCRYEAFCRFAHGKADLQSYANNVRVGLVTEEAVRLHQQARAEELKRNKG